MWEVLGKEGLKLISVHECPQRSQALRCRRRLPVLQPLCHPLLLLSAMSTARWYKTLLLIYKVINEQSAD